MMDNRLIITKKDQQVLLKLLEATSSADPITIKGRDRLQSELMQANLLKEEEVPSDVVRINSLVNLETPFGRKANIQLVLPHLADFQKGKLSVLSPMGTALIGYKQGDQVNWHFRQGDEIITIEEVKNEHLVI